MAFYRKVTIEMTTEMSSAGGVSWKRPPPSNRLEVEFPNTVSNQIFLERCSAGDTDAVSAILSRFSGLIRGLSMQLTGNYDDANDVISEVYIRLYRKLGTCRSAAALPTWIGRVVRNVTTDLRRLSERNPVVSLDGWIENFGDSFLPSQGKRNDSPEVLAEIEERKKILSTAVSALPLNQKMAVKLFYYEEWSHEEIADKMGITIGTVKSRLNRARQALLKKLTLSQLLLNH